MLPFQLLTDDTGAARIGRLFADVEDEVYLPSCGGSWEGVLQRMTERRSVAFDEHTGIAVSEVIDRLWATISASAQARRLRDMLDDLVMDPSTPEGMSGPLEQAAQGLRSALDMGASDLGKVRSCLWLALPRRERVDRLVSLSRRIHVIAGEERHAETDERRVRARQELASATRLFKLRCLADPLSARAAKAQELCEA